MPHDNPLGTLENTCACTKSRHCFKYWFVIKEISVHVDTKKIEKLDDNLTICDQLTRTVVWRHHTTLPLMLWRSNSINLSMPSCISKRPWGVPHQVLLVGQVLRPLSRSNIWPSSEGGSTIFLRWICFCMQWAAVEGFQHHRWSPTPPHSCPNFVYALLQSTHKLRNDRCYSFEIKHSRILFSGDYSPRIMPMSE